MVNRFIEEEDLETIKKGVDPFWVEMSFLGLRVKLCNVERRVVYLTWWPWRRFRTSALQHLLETTVDHYENLRCSFC
jgi:hypothetical protein